MAYYQICAEINSTGIFDDKGLCQLKEWLPISDEVWDELQRWCYEYDKYLPPNPNMSEQEKIEIEEMDKRGILIMEKIRKDCSDKIDAKFFYYSEGFRKAM